MAKDRGSNGGMEPTISIISTGTRFKGEIELEGSLRIEGVVEGTIRAGKAVVVTKDGTVEGDIFTQDAVIAGKVQGLITAASRLEIQASARIDGDIRARRMQLEEGAELNGTLQMGEVKLEEAPPAGKRADATPRAKAAVKEAAKPVADDPQEDVATEPEAAQ